MEKLKVVVGDFNQIMRGDFSVRVFEAADYKAAHEFIEDERASGRIAVLSSTEILDFDAGHGLRAYMTICMAHNWQRSVFAYLYADGNWRAVNNWNTKEMLFQHQKERDDAYFCPSEVAA